MNQQTIPNKLATYPPFDNMPLLHEQEQFNMYTALNQIKSSIPSKYLPIGKSTNVTIENITSQIRMGIETMVKEIPTQQPTEESQTNSIRENEDMVGKLMEALSQSQNKSKKLQIKLLTKIKKLDDQVKEKDLEMNELRNILEEKQIQIDSLTKMNDKKYKQIRTLEEDLYDMEEELHETVQKLQCEQQMSVMMQKKIKSVGAPKMQNPQKLKSIEKANYGVQTIYEDDDDNSSQKSGLTQAKQKNYLQSIQQLTFELTQAYQKINELMKVEGKEDRKKSKSTYLSLFK